MKNPNTITPTSPGYAVRRMALAGSAALALMLSTGCTVSGEQTSSPSTPSSEEVPTPLCNVTDRLLGFVELDSGEREQLAAGQIPNDVEALRAGLAGEIPDTSAAIISLDPSTFIQRFADANAADADIRSYIGMAPQPFGITDSFNTDPSISIDAIRLEYSQHGQCGDERA